MVGLMTIDEAIKHTKNVASEQMRRSGECIKKDKYCDKYSSCIRCSEEHEQLAKWLIQLKEYQKLEEQDRLIKLPCKVGDTVYYISDGFVEPCTIEVIFLANYTDKNGNCSYMAEIHYDREDCPYVSTEIYFTDIGKTVFLAKSEAEAKLKELEGE